MEEKDKVAAEESGSESESEVQKRPLPAFLRPLWEKQRAQQQLKKRLRNEHVKPKSYKQPRLTTEERLARRNAKKAELAQAAEAEEDNE